MRTADKVIAELKCMNPVRNKEGRPVRLSDEMVALCAVLDRQDLKGCVRDLARGGLEHVLKRVPAGYAEGAEPGPTARSRGKREPVE